MKALGIPDRKKKTEIPFYKNDNLELGIHEHIAEKAGKHYDLRLGDPNKKVAYSWAVRHWPKPGERRLAVRQPDHTLAYMSWSGIIPKGYGAGKVNLKNRGVAENVVHKENRINFNIDSIPYTLVNTDEDNWLLLNRGQSS